MIYRDWKFTDNLEIEKLENEIFTSPWNMKMLSDSFTSGIFHGVVAEDDGKVIGYASFEALFEIGNILLIAVKKEYRGFGIGKTLLDKVFEKAEEINLEAILLEVRVSNESAQRLYLSAGFREVNIRKKYYPDGEDALVMKKEF